MLSLTLGTYVNRMNDKAEQLYIDYHTTECEMERAALRLETYHTFSDVPANVITDSDVKSFILDCVLTSGIKFDQEKSKNL